MGRNLVVLPLVLSYIYRRAACISGELYQPDTVTRSYCIYGARNCSVSRNENNQLVLVT